MASGPQRNKEYTGRNGGRSCHGSREKQDGKCWCEGRGEEELDLRDRREGLFDWADAPPEMTRA